MGWRDRSAASRRAEPSDASWFGHPPGFAYLAFTEAWERYSFYGMRALLVLYMVDTVFRPGAEHRVVGLGAFYGILERITGPLTAQAMASMVFGLYAGFVYFTPPIGGWIGDRWLGRRRTVTLGAILMAAGHVMMAFQATFLAALVLLVCGSGCLKGNISAQVGGLYAPDDPRRGDAFSWFNVGINLGAFAGPLVCGALGETFGWSYGFLSAALGMLVGLAIYLAGGRRLPPDPPVGPAARGQPRLESAERKTVAVLIVIMLVQSFFMIAYAQESNVFPLWVRATTDRHLFGFTAPVPWFSSLDGMFCIVLTPLVLWSWRRLARGVGPWHELTRMAIGAFLGAAGMGLLAVASLVAGPKEHVSLLWSVGCFALCATGFLYSWPPLLALVSRAAPAPVNGTLMGLLFAGPFLGNVLAGNIARSYDPLQAGHFWGLHAAIAAAGGSLLLLLAGPLRRVLAQSEPAASTKTRGGQA